jgi:hypothetical protein
LAWVAPLEKVLSITGGTQSAKALFFGLLWGDGRSSLAAKLLVLSVEIFELWRAWL